MYLSRDAGRVRLAKTVVIVPIIAFSPIIPILVLVGGSRVEP